MVIVPEKAKNKTKHQNKTKQKTAKKKKKVERKHLTFEGGQILGGHQQKEDEVSLRKLGMEEAYKNLPFLPVRAMASNLCSRFRGGEEMSGTTANNSIPDHLPKNINDHRILNLN